MRRHKHNNPGAIIQMEGDDFLRVVDYLLESPKGGGGDYLRGMAIQGGNYLIIYGMRCYANY